MAAAIWGMRWQGQHICFNSDNMAVVAIIWLAGQQVHHCCCTSCNVSYFTVSSLSCVHVPRVLNVAADALSRDNLPLFISLVPQAPQFTIPPALVKLLITTRPDWGHPTGLGCSPPRWPGRGQFHTESGKQRYLTYIVSPSGVHTQGHAQGGTVSHQGSTAANYPGDTPKDWSRDPPTFDITMAFCLGFFFIHEVGGVYMPFVASVCSSHDHTCRYPC